MTGPRRLVVAAVVCALAGGVGGCGGNADPIRIAVLADCSGLFVQTKELYVASAALPLLELGGERTASGGVDGVEIAGRRVELVTACTEFTYAHLLVFATRRLVEDDDVDIVIGPIGNSENVAFRELASRYPDVTFVAGVTIAQELTLRDPQPNLFRFMPDGPQIAAGLGGHAFDRLGWRRATIVAEPYSEGWELAAGFAAEFCALGGTVERDWNTILTPDPSGAAARHARERDGVLLAVDYVSPIPYLTAFTAQVGDAVDRRLLLIGGSFFDPANRRPSGADLDGVVLGGYMPLDPDFPGMRRHTAAFEKAFPELPFEPGFMPVVVPITAAMQAVAKALDDARGQLDDGQQTFRKALATNVVDTPYGTVRLDGNRQAEVSIYLERIGRDGASTQIVQTIPNVGQRFGSIFTPGTPSPSAIEPACTRQTPPPWAR